MVETPLYWAIQGCRMCGCSDLRTVIDLGEQVLTGCFPAAGEPTPPRAPLLLVRCFECGLVQLKHSVRPDQMFGENYGYRSGINFTMREHLTKISAAAAARVGLKTDDVVLDIGCNDGTLLNAYEVGGIRRIGLDPIANTFRSMYPNELEVEAEIFTEKAFRAMSPSRDAKIITSISMFYDLEDPAAFVADISRVLDAEGIWILEQSYLPMMLEQTSFDTICHEHLEYYALTQIERLLDRHGLRILDVNFNQINGGSFQVWVCRPDAPYQTNAKKVARILADEQMLGLDGEAIFDAFRHRVASIKTELRDFLLREASDGKKIYVYGASTKGNVILQYLGLDTDVIVACADRNPIKWGRRTPGTDIPIVSEEQARSSADYFLVLPWHFKEEFVAREAEFLKRGKLIFPLPTVEVVGS